MNTTQPTAANIVRANRNNVISVLQAMTTNAILETMRELDKRADDASDILYMMAFDVLASRVGCDMAESHSDEIMNAR